MLPQEILAFNVALWPPCRAPANGLLAVSFLLQLCPAFWLVYAGSFPWKSTKLKVSQLFSKTYFSASPCKFIFFYLTIFVGFVARKLPYKIFDISRRIPGLANISLENEILRWPLRPKQHQMEHLTFDFAVFANPREFSCLLDEDLVGRLKKITAHTHPATMSVWVLEHYAVCAAHRWVGNLHGLKKRMSHSAWQLTWVILSVLCTCFLTSPPSICIYIYR